MHIRRSLNRWQINRPARIKLEGAEVFKECSIADINFKGLQIHLKSTLPQDTFLKLKIALSEDCLLDVEVWVVWYKKKMENNIYGLYFTKITDMDKEKIYRFVYQNFPQEVSKIWRQDFAEEKGGEKMEDRRIFARFKAKFPLRFIDLKANKEVRGLTQDICAKGICLQTEVELPAHTPLEMWLEIPDKGEPLYTRGEVVWSKKVEPDKCCCGVCLDKADLMGLSRVMKAI
ncbi:MAG: hypothetical protein A2984_00755 [Omnitrophica WOR_2 bacterium RIFCSPLOWO2_01_FULL_41_12]|nr:MAG: hypothetical protein A2984_00755 [Omnitrophica WOR_2 bacterium RIFCSPLOWO2_01_FULL_41_12]